MRRSRNYPTSSRKWDRSKIAQPALPHGPCPFLTAGDIWSYKHTHRWDGERLVALDESSFHAPWPRRFCRIRANWDLPPPLVRLAWTSRSPPGSTRWWTTVPYGQDDDGNDGQDDNDNDDNDGANDTRDTAAARVQKKLANKNQVRSRRKRLRYDRRGGARYRHADPATRPQHKNAQLEPLDNDGKDDKYPWPTNKRSGWQGVSFPSMHVVITSPPAPWWVLPWDLPEKWDMSPPLPEGQVLEGPELPTDWEFDQSPGRAGEEVTGCCFHLRSNKWNTGWYSRYRCGYDRNGIWICDGDKLDNGSNKLDRRGNKLDKGGDNDGNEHHRFRGWWEEEEGVEEEEEEEETDPSLACLQQLTRRLVAALNMESGEMW